MRINNEFDINIPETPDFILEQVPELAKDFAKEIPIEDFTDEDLIEIARVWASNLLSQARYRRRKS